MKTNRLGMVIGLALMLIFGVLLFMYQVRVTEVAVRTRFGRVVEEITEPGIKAKLPWPIERIQTFDRRIQNFEDTLETTATRDGRNLLVMVYLGWSIEKPGAFRDRIKEGSIAEAERMLGSIVRSAKNTVVGQHPFSDFINTDESKLKFSTIEEEILTEIRPQTLNYGIQVHFLGIKRMNLPDNITQKVFDDMRAERQKLVLTYQSQGEAEATTIRTAAERDRAEQLAAAESEAKRIKGAADAAAAASYQVFNEEPELAKFQFKLDATEKALRDRATLILDTRTSPFDVLLPQTNTPAARK